MMVEGVLGMTDLEEQLKGSGGRDLRAALLSRLTQLDGDLALKIGTGLRPKDFVRASAIRSAVGTAKSILGSPRQIDDEGED